MCISLYGISQHHENSLTFMNFAVEISKLTPTNIHTHTHTAHTFLLTTSSSLHCSSPSFLHLLLYFVSWSFFSTLDFLPHFPHHIFSCSPINSLFLDCNFSHPASPSRFLRVDCLVIAAAYFSATLPPYLFFLVHSGWSGFDNVRAMEVWRFKGTVSV